MSSLSFVKGTQWLRMAALFMGLLPAAALAQTSNFIYIGGPQYYTVPAGITQIEVVAAGAAGGRASSIQDRSMGAHVRAVLAVVPGEVLTVVVGQQGIDGSGRASFNGGGSGGWGAGGGGGATDLRRAGASTGDYLSARSALLVAGGAGGTDWIDSPTPQGGMGGAPDGGTGVGLNGNSPGEGATQFTVGGGGPPGSDNQGGQNGYGGGGGGYYGGGAASATGKSGGGGGGSSWVAPSALVGTATYGVDSTATNGQLRITALPPATPLPVQLISFTVQAQGRSVAANWRTASEVNSDRFEIERSSDGLTFSKLGAVPAHGTTAVAQAYTYLDAQLPTGVSTLYYRLRQVDFNGSASYSPVRLVAVGANSLAVFPNPAHMGATLVGAAASTTVQVLDALGREVYATTTSAAGTASLALPAGLPGGMYLVRVGNQTTRLTVE